MPVSVTLEAYTFEELSDKAKARARKWWIDGEREIGGSLQENADDIIFYELGKAGYSANYSGLDIENMDMLNCREKSGLQAVWGLYSQGSGVAWYGTLCQDSVAALAKRFLSGPELHSAMYYISRGRVQVEIEGVNKHYHHEHSMEIKMLLERPDGGTVAPEYFDEYGEGFATKKARNALSILVSKIEEDVVSLSRTLRGKLEDEDRYLESDEYVDETIIANEYMFTEGGEREPLFDTQQVYGTTTCLSCGKSYTIAGPSREIETCAYCPKEATDAK